MYVYVYVFLFFYLNSNISDTESFDYLMNSWITKTLMNSNSPLFLLVSCFRFPDWLTFSSPIKQNA